MHLIINNLILEKMKIQSTEKYFEKINNITPRGSTDIEGAFKSILQDELYLETDISKSSYFIY